MFFVWQYLYPIRISRPILTVSRRLVREEIRKNTKIHARMRTTKTAKMEICTKTTCPSVIPHPNHHYTSIINTSNLASIFLATYCTSE